MANTKNREYLNKEITHNDMANIKVGDTVAYLVFNDYTWYYTHDIGVGIVYYISDDYIYLGRLHNDKKIIKLDDKKHVYEVLSENTRENFSKIINEKILEEQSKIRPMTSAEKDKVKKMAFEQKKQQILKTAENMLNSEDDTDFINKLKAITELKKELFTIKLKDVDNIHKNNGEIKYAIKQLKDLLDRVQKFDFKP